MYGMYLQRSLGDQGIEDVDTTAIVVELQYGTRYGDTTLFSISIQSDTACFAVLRDLTDPAK